MGTRPKEYFDMCAVSNGNIGQQMTHLYAGFYLRKNKKVPVIQQVTRCAKVTGLTRLNKVKPISVLLVIFRHQNYLVRFSLHSF